MSRNTRNVVLEQTCRDGRGGVKRAVTDVLG